jgi:hypothetical protein
MRIFSNCLGVIFSGILAVTSPLFSQNVTAASLNIEEGDKAILIKGSGVYHRTISTQEPLAQQFFDQGLRYAWGFYFPESIASYQQAALHDPTHPMVYWGLAHAMGPNPNSRYSGMPDDPKSEGLKAIKQALNLIDKAATIEREMINALYVLYDQESISDSHERDLAYLAAARALQ